MKYPVFSSMFVPECSKRNNELYEESKQKRQFETRFKAIKAWKEAGKPLNTFIPTHHIGNTATEWVVVLPSYIKDSKIRYMAMIHLDGDGIFDMRFKTLFKEQIEDREYCLEKIKNYEASYERADKTHPHREYAAEMIEYYKFLLENNPWE